MANDIGIGEFPVVGMDEDEVELSLGLSIGGSFRKLEKLKTSKPKQSCSSGTDLTKPGEINIGKGENERGFCKSSSVSPIVNGDEIIDPQRKREIHALRRQEARKKRVEKSQRKGICRRRNGGSNIPIRTCSIDDKIFLQAQMFQSRVRDREKAEGDGYSDEQYNTNLSLKNNQPLNQNPNSNSFGVSSSPQFPIVPHMQYVRFANGFGIPYVMPCLKMSCATADDDKNVLQQFFQDQNPNRNRNLLARSVLEKKTSQSSIDSSGSSWRSSSSVSDYKSTSTQGGSSSESKSHSSNSPKEQLHLHGNTEEQSIHSNSSFPKGVEAFNNEKDTLVSSKMSQTDPNMPEKPISINKLKEAKGGKTKPPRPKIPHSHSQTLFLPQIPCVSTTGNGPNGKTIKGFLYRYTKKEVSIICVCHGSSFSPAEFVKHAGGEDISHPLRHIVVVPSTL